LSRPLLPPGTCWICDQSPQQDEYRVIDTRRNARPGGPTTHESVRKYICEPCAREMGDAIGMVAWERHVSVVDALASTRETVAHTEYALSKAEAAQTRVVSEAEILAALKDVVRGVLDEQAQVPEADDA
jgi:hypothetical protein